MRTAILFTCILCLLLNRSTTALELTRQQATTLLQEAASSFRSGTDQQEDDPDSARTQFAAAAEKYELLIRSGFATADVYENLGNAYMQADDPVRALAAFEQATRRAPHDWSLGKNVSAARSAAGRDTKAIAIGSFARQINASVPRIVRLIVGLAAWTICWWALAARLSLPGSRTIRRIVFGASIVCGLCSVSLLAEWYTLPADEVLVLEPTELRRSDAPTAETIRQVDPGERFALLVRQKDWIRVQIAPAEPSGREAGTQLERGAWLAAGAVSAIEQPESFLPIEQ